MPAKKTSKQIVKEAFDEVYSSKPSTLGKNQTKAEERAQLTAIALSKSRKAGADIPKPRKRGSTAERQA